MVGHSSRIQEVLGLSPTWGKFFIHLRDLLKNKILLIYLIYKIVTLASAFSDCIVGFIAIQVFNYPWLGDFCTMFASFWSIAPFNQSGY